MPKYKMPGMPKLPKITSAIFLQCFKKEVSEVYFLHADKYESLLQIDTMIQVEW